MRTEFTRDIIITDFSHIEETNCYCSPQSAETIRQKILSFPINAIHFIGTGDYHYQTLFWLERLTEPFSLVLIDNHPDDQQSAFTEELLSCGGWVEQARKLPLCKRTVWIREASDYCHLTSSPESIKNPGSISEVGMHTVYLSVDIDVLSQEYAHTDWSQGEMTLEELLTLCRRLSEEFKILGADICGGITEDKGGTDADFALNQRTIRAIADAIL